MKNLETAAGTETLSNHEEAQAACEYYLLLIAYSNGAAIAACPLVSCLSSQLRSRLQLSRSCTPVIRSSGTATRFVTRQATLAQAPIARLGSSPSEHRDKQILVCTYVLI